MLQVLSDRLSDDVGFGLIPTDAGSESMNFQARERANRERDMIHLRSGGPRLRLLDAAALLDASMIVLDGPCASAQFFELALTHLKVVGCPVPRVPIRGDCPKHPDEPVSSEMNLSAAAANLNVSNSDVASPIGIELSVGLEPGEPQPAMRANSLQILQRTVPTVEQNILRRKASLGGSVKHVSEVFVLVLSSNRLVIDSKVAWNDGLSIRPHKAYQVYAQDHLVMFAAPVSRHKFDSPRVGLVQCGIIHNQDSLLLSDNSACLCPQRLCVGRLSCEQTSESVMGGSGVV